MGRWDERIIINVVDMNANQQEHIYGARANAASIQLHEQTLLPVLWSVDASTSALLPRQRRYIGATEVLLDHLWHTDMHTPPPQTGRAAVREEGCTLV